MKKWMLVVLVLAGSVSWGQAQIKIGNDQYEESVECGFGSGFCHYLVG